MSLSNQQRKYLRNFAHGLKPVVMIGEKGLTDNVAAEIDLALKHHELIKIRVSSERDARDAMIAEIVNQSAAELVQRIGNVAVLYRTRPANYKAGPRTQLYSIKLPKA